MEARVYWDTKYRTKRKGWDGEYYTCIPEKRLMMGRIEVGKIQREPARPNIGCVEPVYYAWIAGAYKAKGYDTEYDAMRAVERVAQIKHPVNLGV